MTNECETGRFYKGPSGRLDGLLCPLQPQMFHKAISKNKGREETILCVAFIHFSDINTPTMAKFNPC